MDDPERSDEVRGYGLPFPDPFSYYVKNAKRSIFDSKYYFREDLPFVFEFRKLKDQNQDDFYNFLENKSTFPNPTLE